MNSEPYTFGEKNEMSQCQRLVCLYHSKTLQYFLHWRRLRGAQGHVPPLLQMAAHGGTVKNSEQETDQTVLTITKTLTKTTNDTCRAKKGHDKNFLRRFASDVCPTFKFVPAPLILRDIQPV